MRLLAVLSIPAIANLISPEAGKLAGPAIR